MNYNGSADLEYADPTAVLRWCRTLHPQVVEAVRPLLNGRRDDELMFQHGPFWMWIKREQIPMSQFKGHFVLGDLRKFAEQYGDVIQWDQSNRAYILTHGVSGIDWKHYKHPLPEHVYDVYMKYWGDVSFKIGADTACA